MKLEVHVHTKYSKDSLLCFLPLYLKCRIKKIDCIAITEHNDINGGLKFKEFCEKRGGKVKVIVGEEIFTEDGEIIGLFLNDEIAQGLSAKETIDLIKQQGGVVYVPHPYDEKRNKTVLSLKVISEYRDLIDCIEIHNGRNVSSRYDCKQLEIANANNIIHVIGSDAHTLLEIGRNYIEVEELPTSPEIFLREIKRAKFHKKNSLSISHIITKIVKFLKLMFRGNFNEIRRIINRKIKRNKR